MTIQTAQSNDDIIFWQSAEDGNGDYLTPEPAILLCQYSDTIEIVQDNKSILVSRTKKNVGELIKALKQIHAELS